MNVLIKGINQKNGMKEILFWRIDIIYYNIGFAQSMGVGTNSPDASAVLDITSTSRHFILILPAISILTMVAKPAGCARIKKQLITITVQAIRNDGC
jgi:hypothetical protein